MLVEFSSKAYENIVMFERHAIKLIAMMGFNKSIPGAILAKDMPEALLALEKALSHTKEDVVDDDEEDSDEEVVSLKQRAFPLMSMLQHAIVKSVDIMWDYY